MWMGFCGKRRLPPNSEALRSRRLAGKNAPNPNPKIAPRAKRRPRAALAAWPNALLPKWFD